MLILCVGGDALNECVYFSVFTFTLNFSYTNEMSLYNFTLSLTSPKLYVKHCLDFSFVFLAPAPA
jgi:hypothetical protein